jgi:hypothetical protein
MGVHQQVEDGALGAGVRRDVLAELLKLRPEEGIDSSCLL